MIAKFLVESKSIIMKNSSFKDFVRHTFSNKTIKETNTLDELLNDTGYRFLELTDGKPGEWCVVEDPELGERTKMLIVSFSEKGLVTGLMRNYIGIFRFMPEDGYLISFELFDFSKSVYEDDEEKQKIAAQYTRNLMRDPAVQRGGKSAEQRLEKASTAYHRWGKGEEKGI